MKKTSKKTTRSKKNSWILFFYSIPAKPVKNRVRIWRRLAGAGAVQLKGAVYVLPWNEDHHEFCQWLMTEVAAAGGEGDFVLTDSFGMLGNDDIVSLFKRQRENDYRTLGSKLNDLEVRLNSVEKGSRPENAKEIQAQFERLLREYSDITEIDFFPSRLSDEMNRNINALQENMIRILQSSAGKGTEASAQPIPRRSIEDYKKRTWITRKHPFVDRMASAWLIRKFIDGGAVFQFTDDRGMKNVDDGSVVFDAKNGELTHVGELCTFEVIVKSFGIKDRAVKKIAEVVHELDVKDDRFHSPEARGIADILTGIRKTGKGDSVILEKGMAVFEMLYASKS